MSSTPDFLSVLGDDSSSQQPTNVSQTPRHANQSSSINSNVR